MLQCTKIELKNKRVQKNVLNGKEELRTHRADI